MQEIEQITQLLYNPLSALLLVLVTGLRGDWVFGWIYRERMAQLLESRNAWKDEAQRWRELVQGEKS